MLPVQHSLTEPLVGAAAGDHVSSDHTIEGTTHTQRPPAAAAVEHAAVDIHSSPASTACDRMARGEGQPGSWVPLQVVDAVAVDGALHRGDHGDGVILWMGVYSNCCRVYFLPLGIFVLVWGWILFEFLGQAGEFPETILACALWAIPAFVLAMFIFLDQTTGMEVTAEGVVATNRISRWCKQGRMSFSDMDQIIVQRPTASVRYETPTEMQRIRGAFTSDYHRVVFKHRSPEGFSVKFSPKDLDTFLAAIRRTRAAELITYVQ
jgi:hypothetical protein